MIVRCAEFWLGVTVSPPGLEVSVCFAERESPFPAFPESLCRDEDASEYGVVEWFGRDASKGEGCGVAEHRVIEAENIDTREAGECPEAVVEFVEVFLDAALILIQDGPCDARVLACDVACRGCPGKESSDGVGFGSWLALRVDSLPCFTNGDVGKVKQEFAALCSFQEFRCRGDLVVCRCGIREKPVGFYEDV
ncbi:MAG: hypothetical protein LAP38_20700 [Acidobacteriia bacterium]|nr:hypothetical protein [Terriglobia bacterium]